MREVPSRGHVKIGEWYMPAPAGSATNCVCEKLSPTFFRYIISVNGRPGGPEQTMMPDRRYHTGPVYVLDPDTPEHDEVCRTLAEYALKGD